MIWLWLLLQTPVTRPYWPITVAQAAAGTSHTHIQVTGTVVYVRREVDGDTHLRIVGDTGTAFLVGEIIPAIPLRIPKVGERITIRGIYRRDPEHGNWAECHPIEWESP